MPAKASQSTFRRRWLQRILAVFLGCLFAGVAAEILVLALLGEQPKFPRRVVGAPWGLRYNQPRAKYRHKSADVNVRFQINAQGMRGSRDYPYSKPENTQRILSLGDSFTIGYEVAFENCFSSIVERTLNEHGVEVEVLNAGVSGFSNAEELLYLERELLKYDPDLVLVSFYSNDLKDNIRTGLFRVEDEQLVEKKERYVPAGGLGDFLNTNLIFNVLSERSNAFVFAKERLTILRRRGIVRRNLEREFQSPEKTNTAAEANATVKADTHKQELAAAIFERMYQLLRDKQIPLVVHCIPSRAGYPHDRLEDRFPYERFDFDRPGLHHFAAADVLRPIFGKQQLYWNRSHKHWTPLSHRLAGEGLANLIMEAKLLEPLTENSGQLTRVFASEATIQQAGRHEARKATSDAARR